MLRSLAFTALFAMAGTAAAADKLYTYTGNTFDENHITSEPASLVGHFVFDFDNSPDAANGYYAMKRWDIGGAGIEFDSNQPRDPFVSFNPIFKFEFDDQGNPTKWAVILYGGSTGFGGLVSVKGFSDTNDAVYYSATSGPFATVVNNPGTWSMSNVSPVPEPESLGMFGAGFALLAAVRAAKGRKKQQEQLPA
jgi:hypothetical protein